MNNHEVIEAEWVEGLPDADGDSRYFSVSSRLHRVTRITVQQDLPGIHGNMRRVCVWVGDHLLFEAPVHNVQGIGYAVPPKLNHD